MKNKKLISDITLDAFFLAIITVMTFIPYIGFITIGLLSITLIPIPVMIGSLFLGWKRGLLYGFMFGIVSLIKALGQPAGTFDAYFVNPLISVLPRVLFGLFAGIMFGLVGKYIKRLPQVTVLLAGCAALATLFHSVLVLGMLMIVNPVLFPELIYVAWPNVIAEVVVGFLIIPILYSALHKPFAARALKYSEPIITKKEDKENGL